MAKRRPRTVQRWRTIAGVRVGITSNFESYQRFARKSPKREVGNYLKAANPLQSGVSAKKAPQERILVYVPRTSRRGVNHELLHGFEAIIASRIGEQVVKGHEMGLINEGIIRAIDRKHENPHQHSTITLTDFLREPNEPIKWDKIRPALVHAYPIPSVLRRVILKMANQTWAPTAFRALNKSNIADDKQAVEARKKIIKFLINNAPRKKFRLFSSLNQRP